MDKKVCYRDLSPSLKFVVVIVYVYAGLILFALLLALIGLILG